MKNKKSACRAFFTSARHRWSNAMPIFFRRLFWVCSLISGTALAANTAMQTAGVSPHDWWTDVLPYLIGFPAGIAFAAKFTQQYHGRPVGEDHAHADEDENDTLESNITT